MGKFIYGKLHKISDMPVNLAKIIQNITSMVLPIQSVAFHKFIFFTILFNCKYVTHNQKHNSRSCYLYVYHLILYVFNEV